MRHRDMGKVPLNTDLLIRYEHRELEGDRVLKYWRDIVIWIESKDEHHFLGELRGVRHPSLVQVVNGSWESNAPIIVDICGLDSTSWLDTFNHVPITDIDSSLTNIRVSYLEVLSYRVLGEKEAPLYINWYWLSDSFKHTLFGS